MGTCDQISSKIHRINNKFNIAESEDISSELNRLYSEGFAIYRDMTRSNLDMWQTIQASGHVSLPKNSENSPHPTSSADVKQTFSDTKLIKTILRNRPSDASLEALLIIDEEARLKNELITTDIMLNCLDLFSLRGSE